MRLAVVGRVRARVCFSRLMDESERSRSRAGAHVGPGSVLGQGRVGDNGTSPAAPRRRQTGLPDKEAIDRRAVRNHSFAQSVVSDTPTHAVFAYARVRVTLRDKCLSDNTNKKSQPFIYKRNLQILLISSCKCKKEWPRPRQISVELAGSKLQRRGRVELHRGVSFSCFKYLQVNIL